MTHAQPDWISTRRIVLSTMVACLHAFVAEEPAARTIVVSVEDVVVTHSGGSWAWRVAKEIGISLGEGGARAIPWQVEIWVRDRRPHGSSRIKGLRSLAVGRSHRAGAVHPGEDPGPSTETIVRRELEAQLQRS